MDLCIHLPSHLLTLPSINSSTCLSTYFYPSRPGPLTLLGPLNPAQPPSPAVLTYLSSWVSFIFDVLKFTLMSLLNGVLPRVATPFSTAPFPGLYTLSSGRSLKPPPSLACAMPLWVRSGTFPQQSALLSACRPPPPPALAARTCSFAGS